MLLSALAATDCSVIRSRRDTVRIPNMDETAPLAALDVVGRDTTLILTVGQEPAAVDLAKDDSLVLIAIGEDGDGGVKDISLSGNAVVTCKDAKTGKTATRSTGFLRRTVAGSAIRHRGPIRKSSRFVLRTEDFAALCPARSIQAVVGQATARTVNFRGGHAASPRLEFRLSVAAPAVSAAPGKGARPAVAARILLPPGSEATASAACPLENPAKGSPTMSASAADPAGHAPLCSDGEPVPEAEPGAVPSDPSVPAIRTKTSAPAPKVPKTSKIRVRRTARI